MQINVTPKIYGVFYKLILDKMQKKGSWNLSKIS